MARGSSATAEALVRMPLDKTFEIATPLSPVGFYPKFGPIPATVDVRGQTGAWDAPGQTRQLMLSDGGWVIEHTKIVEKPGLFVYELTDFQKVFGVLVKFARAEWRFSDESGATRIHWTYTFYPRRGAALPLAAIIRFVWAPYMRRVLPGIAAEVERRA